MPGHDIIVIGASAGGVEAATQLVRSLPADIPAAIFVVIHIAAHGNSVLPQIFQRRGHLPATHPKDGETIQHGQVYVAPPDLHLIIKSGYINLAHGPKENRHRPAVDPLFRSAARAYQSRVIGVILSGALDDGTAGLLEIKKLGGIAIVQDPEEALYDGMPGSAIENVQVDYVLSIAEIGEKLVTLAHEPVETNNNSVDPQLEVETDMAELDREAVQSLERPGKESPYSCPECGGVLWEINNGNFLRFRCRTGHAFSPDSLFAEQSESLEQALWVALRALKEQSALSKRLADRAKAQNHPIAAERFAKRVQETDARAEVIRRVLVQSEDKTFHNDRPEANTEDNNLETDMS
ncbi:chemotaxis protein CheB [[Phormidium ambiguum] IAM M-71]|uniref:protein-glutamate methylesterase n=1 Tax=[Phormidium ambiguum] IAM M-71 TaxID=454136 RepID=A0A1U7IP38_9CYAN|nr:chemotaxis protein CheB [Phormidium ambiguum]OKH39019.1 chemotaxis protein CheB [Phormidium ambiguum IAM M-71]